jgi:hypothetical protein
MVRDRDRDRGLPRLILLAGVLQRQKLWLYVCMYVCMYVCVVLISWFGYILVLCVDACVCVCVCVMNVVFWHGSHSYSHSTKRHNIQQNNKILYHALLPLYTSMAIK